MLRQIAHHSSDLHSPALIHGQFHISRYFTIVFVRYDSNRYSGASMLLRGREDAKGFHIDTISKRSELCFFCSSSDHVVGCEE